MMCTMDAPQVLRSACVMLAALPTPWICTAQERPHKLCSLVTSA